MAERRMFSKKVVSSARFLRMPQTARLLYYDLGVQADDDGIVEAFTVLQMTRSSEADLEVLEEKGFIQILNEDLVTYICDWKVNNYIQKDRYRPSIYANLLGNLGDSIEQEQSGIKSDTACIQNGYIEDTQDRLGKGRLDKVSIGKDRERKSMDGEPSSLARNDSDSIRREFIELFQREPDQAFLPSVRLQLSGEYTEQGILEIMQQSAMRKPRNPEAYILAALKQRSQEVRAMPDSAQGQPLADWEKEWLEDVRRGRERFAREQDGEQQEGEEASV